MKAVDHSRNDFSFVSCNFYKLHFEKCCKCSLLSEVRILSIIDLSECTEQFRWISADLCRLKNELPLRRQSIKRIHNFLNKKCSICNLYRNPDEKCPPDRNQFSNSIFALGNNDFRTQR